MKTQKSLHKIVAIGFLAIAVIMSGLSLYKKTSLKKNLKDAQLRSEILLSEKLSLDKSLAKFNADLNEAKKNNAALNRNIIATNQKIQAKNSEIARLKSENVSITTLKKKNSELEELLKSLNLEMTALNQLVEQANLNNKKLQDQLALSAKTNNGLSSDNSILKAIISDNYRTEALRGKNDKLTVTANRTNKLMVSFDLPGNSSDNIYFKVVTPGGKELSSNEDLAAEIQIIELGDGLLASLSENAIAGAGTKRVEMTYKPNKKLAKGVYQFNIYNGSSFLGSTQMRLK